jgi:hypothetical protein
METCHERERMLTVREASDLIGEPVGQMRIRFQSGDLPVCEGEDGLQRVKGDDLDRAFGLLSSRYGDDVRSRLVPVLAYERGEPAPIDV